MLCGVVHGRLFYFLRCRHFLCSLRLFGRFVNFFILCLFSYACFLIAMAVMLLTVVLAIYRLGSYASDQLFVVAVGSCALDHRNQRQNCTYRECNRDCHDDDVRSDIRKAETEQDAVLEQK